jgi:hypothetical protein
MGWEREPAAIILSGAKDLHSALGIQPTDVVAECLRELKGLNADC